MHCVLNILPTKFYDAAATRSAAAICCSNQKCCCNVFQNCLNVKLRLLVHFYMLYWSGRLPLWSKKQYAANCSILQHICSTSIGRGFKLREVCQTWLNGVFLHALSIWRASPLIRVTVCCKLQHICSTSIARAISQKL